MGSGGRVLLPGYTPGGGANKDTEIPGGGSRHLSNSFQSSFL